MAKPDLAIELWRYATSLELEELAEHAYFQSVVNVRCRVCIAPTLHLSAVSYYQLSHQHIWPSELGTSLFKLPASLLPFQIMPQLLHAIAVRMMLCFSLKLPLARRLLKRSHWLMEH
jgi:hypothetical protein